jgi:tetratricopeptide (TPR) repeat protein
MTAFDKARDAFKGGDYANALTLADQAVKAVPGDSAVHEFRAQVLIALGRYDDAAAALYGVLSVGPGWDWTTLISLYPDAETYTAQQRALEKSVRTDPESAAPRFVLAYLYLTEGQNSAAEEQLRAVTQLQPGDRVSAQLLQSLSKTAAATGAPGATPPSDAEPKAAAPPAKEGKLQGTWTASPAEGTVITVNVAPGGKFTWKVASAGQSHGLSGESTYGGGVLTLVPAGGNAPMVGEVKWQDDGRFVFQALGGGAGDPGLTFSRSS